jgi:hypothetical protein
MQAKAARIPCVGNSPALMSAMGQELTLRLTHHGASPPLLPLGARSGLGALTGLSNLNHCVARGRFPVPGGTELGHSLLSLEVHINHAEPCAEPVAPQTDNP